MSLSPDHNISTQLQSMIQSHLDQLGLLCRVFSRAKSEHSIQKKISRTPGKYSADGKKIQDAFGVRVALYFPDDQPVAMAVLKRHFSYDAESSTIDTPDGSVFTANRCNLVFRLPAQLIDQSVLLESFDVLDQTFEVQIRTILSEGWHEVEHDLRYKCQDDWESYGDLGRALNGIFASLETSDWGMMKVFETLAHRHYKAGEWTQMIRTKFRLRSESELSSEVIDILRLYPETGKRIFRINRQSFLDTIINYKIEMPITADNIVYLGNYSFVGSPEIHELTPPPLLNIFTSSGAGQYAR
ncbi:MULTISPECIES: hypothetical protein [unclassified Pseudomonas]|uniref:hypothetical protein n=1 Tax=unclassified Pseudomonas TaxID=196821 RepID=UPI001AE2F5B4|nr:MULTISPECIES: hypothetical protein [unclassified Pseudomonas]MBP2272717.1 ppGpp synthetase/RelA/SpoT-type nucleotidyltransferase [Pseudomonas sp. BP6]MBP2288312.1 ppGpp synthetase/RelA/SpoT-type nucleotidyltransferase [Pseudomonas sp. BP7]HDS1699017.1 hypothetical protein [Pseudomonas putida]HDS1704151.1 hypothetical protein [Pseudomonas putida]